MNGSDASLVRAIRGPITLITLGVLFALNNFTPFQFHQTWPILLIVFGLLSLLRRGVDPTPRPYPQAAPPYPFPPPGTPPAGSYRQSQYPEPPQPSTPAKGGFGSSAGSTRPDDPGQNPGGSV
jgi:Domain of unknown function (DUF5668)